MTAPTDDAPTDPDGPGPGSTGTTGSTNTTTPATTTRPPRPRHWVIRWILMLGPEAPTSPRIEIKPYLELLRHQCDEALASAEPINDSNPSSAVYRGAANACLAAFHQQPQRWEEAGRFLATAKASSADLNCAEQATMAWLELVVDRHAKDPEREFEAQEPQGYFSSVQRLVPDHGPPGVQVRVEGSNLGCAEAVAIHKGDQRPVFVSWPDLEIDPGGGSATFPAPTGFDPGPVEVEVRAREDFTMGRATFTYEAP